MDQKEMCIVFSSGISNLTDYNDSFDSGVLRVAYTGKNRNNSFISKETYEKCIHSIYNCPIVCRYDRETDSIGSHDMELVSNENGDMRIVNITQPVGVVPESAKYWWENIEDDSGTHEYLCIDVLLWKRQEAYEKIKRDGVTDESMEITVREGMWDGDIYVIKDFQFTAFCLLGSAEPCFESASLTMFSKDEFMGKFAEMMRELKYAIRSSCSPDGEDLTDKISMEGGSNTLDVENKFSENVAESETEVDNTEHQSYESAEDEGRKVVDVRDDDDGEGAGKGDGAEGKGDDAGENGEGAEGPEHGGEDDGKDAGPDVGGQIEDEPDNGDTFSLLSGELTGELVRILESAEVIETCFGETSRYGYVDHDTERSMVFAYDLADDWKLYGFVYSVDGDCVHVDFESKKRMKFAIVEFEGCEQDNMFSSVFSAAQEKFMSSRNEWEKLYQSAEDRISEMDSELSDLREFKAEYEHNSAVEARNDVISAFEDLSGNEAFEELREHMCDYAVDVLEEKCFAIRGRVNSTMKFSNSTKPTRLKVVRSNNENEPYGGAFAEFGFTAEN